MGFIASSRKDKAGGPATASFADAPAPMVKRARSSPRVKEDAMLAARMQMKGEEVKQAMYAAEEAMSDADRDAARAARQATAAKALKEDEAAAAARAAAAGNLESTGKSEAAATVATSSDMLFGEGGEAAD